MPFFDQHSMTTDSSALLDPARCAVAVIDLQNDFCHADGTFGRIGYDTSRVQSILPDVQILIDAAHAADVPTIFLRTTDGPWSDTPAWSRRPRVGDTSTERIPLVEEGSWGAEFYNLTPQPCDLVLTKHRYSGFAYTPLELALRAKGRDTLVLAGALTDVCLEATAVDAIAAGFLAVLISECSAAASDELQVAAEATFADHIGAVVSLRALQDAWLYRPAAADIRQ